LFGPHLFRKVDEIAQVAAGDAAFGQIDRRFGERQDKARHAVTV